MLMWLTEMVGELVICRWQVLSGSVWRIPTRASTPSSTIILPKTSATRFAAPSRHAEDAAQRAADTSMKAVCMPLTGSAGPPSGTSDP